MVKIHLWN